MGICRFVLFSIVPLVPGIYLDIVDVGKCLFNEYMNHHRQESVSQSGQRRKERQRSSQAERDIFSKAYGSPGVFGNLGGVRGNLKMRYDTGGKQGPIELRM